MHSKFEKDRINTFKVIANLRCKVKMVGTNMATPYKASYDDFAKKAANAMHVAFTIPTILT